MKESLGLTIARLFDMARMSAREEELRVDAMRRHAVQRSLQEQAAREQVLARMRAQAQASLAGSMVGTVPGSEYMLGRMGPLPYHVQLAAAQRGM